VQYPETSNADKKKAATQNKIILLTKNNIVEYCEIQQSSGICFAA
jgi:hypothetical protein